jgi:hypothetical protein
MAPLRRNTAPDGGCGARARRTLGIAAAYPLCPAPQFR